MTKRYRGASLIEIGVVLLFMSLAMAPIVSSMGGKVGSGKSGDKAIALNEATRDSEKQLTAANTLLERALAGDVSVSFDVTNKAAFPDGASLVLNKQMYNAYTKDPSPSQYRKPVYYDWALKDVSFKFDDAGKLMRDANNQLIRVAPTNSRVVQATLRVYTNDTDSSPILVFPTYIYRQDGNAQADPPNTTGIVFVQDTSGSMAWATKDNTWELQYDDNNNVSSPFMWYRQEGGGIDNSLKLNLWNNTQLDIVSGMPADDPLTKNVREDYLKGGLFNLPAGCGTQSNWPAATSTSDPSYSPLFTVYDSSGNNTTQTTRIKAAAALCQDKSTVAKDSNYWEKIASDYLSRIEASRSALLNFELKAEASPLLASNIRLGLVSFSTDVTTQAGLAATLNKDIIDENGESKKKPVFEAFRTRASWINRATKVQAAKSRVISPEGATNIYAGLERAANLLYKDPNVSQRIIVLVTDGYPTWGGPENTTAGLKAYTEKLGLGTASGANGKKITLFCVGLIGYDRDLMTAMAQNTPNGQAFFANNVQELKGVFDQLFYEIQGRIMINAAQRYNLPVDLKTL